MSQVKVLWFAKLDGLSVVSVTPTLFEDPIKFSRAFELAVSYLLPLGIDVVVLDPTWLKVIVALPASLVALYTLKRIFRKRNDK